MRSDVVGHDSMTSVDLFSRVESNSLGNLNSRNSSFSRIRRMQSGMVLLSA